MISATDAFSCGHNLSYSASYFDQVLFAAKLANHQTPNAGDHANRMIEKLQQVAPNFARRIQDVEHIAAKANLSKQTIPTLPPEYYPWVQTRHGEFLEFWPADDIRGALFVIGHAIGEIRNGLIIHNLSLDFEKNLQIKGEKVRGSIPNRMEETMERWKKAMQLMDAVIQNHMSTVQVLENHDNHLACLGIVETVHTNLLAQLETMKKLHALPLEKQDITIAMNHKVLQILGKTEQECMEKLDL